MLASPRYGIIERALTWTQNVQDMKPHHVRNAITRTTASRPLARVHIDNFISGGAVQNDFGLSGRLADFSR